MTRFAALSILLLACGGGSSTASPQTLPTTSTSAPKTYAVQLSHPSRAGERLHVVSDQIEEKSTKVTMGDQVIDDKHEKRVLHLDSISTVLTVNESGRATRTRDEVKELTVDGKVVVKGVVEIQRAPKEKDAVITVDGAPASEEARDALKTMLKLGTSGPTDDDVFGTKTAQAIGAHWAVNTQLAHDDLRDDAGLDSTNVTGDAWLEGVGQVGGKDALDVRAKLTLDGLTPNEIPAGSTVELGRADVDLQAALPVDGKPERMTDHMTMKVAFKLRVKTPKGPALVAVTLGEHREAKFSLP
jgi:hypothetical protein